jgi:hypothetical protein
MSEPQSNTQHGSCANCGAWWRLPVLLAVVLVAVVALRGGGIRQPPQTVPSPNPTPDTIEPITGPAVSLELHVEGGLRLVYPPLAWREGMTVADLLAAGQRTMRLDFVVQGSGASALLTEMGGYANEDASGRNWTYTVNGQRADRSFAIRELEPGDEVLWRFGRTE